MTSFFNPSDLEDVTTALVRLLVAGFLGALIGWQREKVHSAAGLRTHILVALGAALFVLGGANQGSSPAELSRVFQGIAAGVGFLGAGVILKRTDQMEIHGLTTAASVWLTAAVGAASAAGRFWLPAAGAILGWVVLGPLATLERKGPTADVKS